VIPTGNPTFSSIPDLDRAPSTFHGVGECRNSRWRPPRLQSRKTIERNDAIPTAAQTFGTMLGSSLTLPTMPDVG
jgi:hypothetical protein